MNFQWNPALLPQGTFFLKDVVTGQIVNVDMKTTNNLWVTNTNVTSLQIVYSRQVCKNVLFATSWNILSVPVSASNMNASVLFPGANSLFYGFDNGYVSATSLTNGKRLLGKIPAGIYT